MFKKNTTTFLCIITIIVTYINSWLFVAQAAEWAPTGLLNGIKDVGTVENWVATEWSKSASERIRTGDLHLDDVPNVIKGLIDIFIGLAGTIAVIFVIYWSYRLLFGSLSWDHTKWRETIIMALTGFVIAILSWFIVKLIFNNLV